MSELHVIMVRQIEGKSVEADLDLDCDQLEALPRSEQALTLLQAYDTVKAALVDAEVNGVCEEIKNLISFKDRRQDIPIQ